MNCYSEAKSSKVALSGETLGVVVDKAIESSVLLVRGFEVVPVVRVLQLRDQLKGYSQAGLGTARLGNVMLG